MGETLMLSFWFRNRLLALQTFAQSTFAGIIARLTFAQRPGVATAAGMQRPIAKKISSVTLWRVAFVVLSTVILAQAWSPRPLTAQSPTQGSSGSTNGGRNRNAAGNRPQEFGGPAANPGTQNPKRFATQKAGQPRQIVDLKQDGNQQPDVDRDVPPPRAVRPNRVAQAELRQEERPNAGANGQFPEMPQFKLDQFVNTEQLVSPQGLKSSLGVGLVVTIFSLAPAILMMSTCFVRFIVVLSLLRQALGTPNLPPNQVLMGLSLCLTFLVMAPVWNESYQQGVRPYVEATSNESRPNLPAVFDKTVAPIRRFMSQQIERSNNADAVWMFVEYQRPTKNSPAAESWEEPQTYDDVPLTVLLPAYLLSELKTAFLIGFQIYLPFLIIDLVVASVLMSMGLPMLSPTQVSLPFKLLLFVLIDGWTLTVGMLIESVRA
jgi:flagellar biosynthetic protein FliP